MIIVYTAPVVPLLRLELAHVFTLRTECHPENKCPLNPVVRSSGLILAFLKSQPETSTARRQHGAPSPTRRANTARQCGRLVAPLVAQGGTELKKPLYDRVWWVETSTACARPSASMWHGILMEVVEQAFQRLPLCCRRAAAPSLLSQEAQPL